MNITPLEKDEAKKLVQYLRLRGFKFMHIPSETGSTPEARRRAIRMKQQGTVPGFPDYVIIADNRMLAVELKRIKGSKVSDEQKEWLAALSKAGVDAFISYGADDAIEYLEANYKRSKEVDF